MAVGGEELQEVIDLRDALRCTKCLGINTLERLPLWCPARETFCVILHQRAKEETLDGASS